MEGLIYATILLVFASAGTVWLFIWIKFGARIRYPEEPPLVSGWLPYIGIALEYNKKCSLRFFQKLQKTYGDIVTVRLTGKYITYIFDAHSFDKALYRQEKKLDFDMFAQLASHRAFESPLLRDSNLDLEQYQRLFRTEIQGESLAQLTQTMSGELQRCLGIEEMVQFSSENAQNWQERGLFDFCSRIMFRAALRTWFGQDRAFEETWLKLNNNLVSRESVREAFETESFNATELKQYLRLDKVFPMLIDKSIPTCVLGINKDRECLQRLFTEDKCRKRQNKSNFISKIGECLKAAEFSDKEKQGVYLALLFASQTNTVPAAFWTVYYLLRDRHALQAVKDEISTVLLKSDQNANNGHKWHLKFDTECLQEMKILESAILESMRLKSLSTCMRYIKDEDFKVTMDSGAEYSLRQGDFIAIFPALVHFDPEIYENPEVFQHDRFLNADGTEKTTFHKNERKVKHYLTLFGGGVSLCPGKSLSMNEIKQFVSLLLTYYDIELANAGDPELTIEKTRFAFGIQHPASDPIIKYKICHQNSSDQPHIADISKFCQDPLIRCQQST